MDEIGELQSEFEWLKPYWWHNYMFGVPCGPTLQMMDGYQPSVEDIIKTAIRQDFLDQVDLSLIGISLKDQLIEWGFEIKEEVHHGVV
jgi:hypothetical protein